MPGVCQKRPAVSAQPPAAVTAAMDIRTPTAAPYHHHRWSQTPRPPRIPPTITGANFMLMVISPAKTLDFESKPVTPRFTQPQYLDHSQALIEQLRELSPAQISDLMHVSDKIGGLNAARFGSWTPAFTPETPSRPCWPSRATSTRASTPKHSATPISSTPRTTCACSRACT